jgi:uracil-DNA glycosylase family 4
MKGFFELEKPVKPKAPVKKKSLDCEACGLYKQVKSPRMPVTGYGRKGVFGLGEGPGRKEDEQNKQFVGDSGDLLREALTENGYQLDRDFYKQNAVRCRPTDSEGNNRPPSKEELQCCEQFWRTDITDKKPKFIFLFGGKAVEAFYGDRGHSITSDLSIGRWVRTCVPDVKTEAWIVSLYHPSFAIRTPDAKVRFKKDVKWGLEQLDRKPPEFPDWKKQVAIITRFDDLWKLFQRIEAHRLPIVIDYETSGLRPYKSGHHVWSASIYFNRKAYSFPYSYPNHWTADQFEKIEGCFKKILADPEVPKIAQSIQMEDSWSRRVIGQPVIGWLHDTMVCSHVINEHRKFTGLDFQTFINWGYEYGENIAPFKNLDETTGFNRMHEVPLLELLEYNGLDSLFAGMLFERQVRIIGENLC